MEGIPFGFYIAFFLFWGCIYLKDTWYATTSTLRSKSEVSSDVKMQHHQASSPSSFSSLSSSLSQSSFTINSGDTWSIRVMAGSNILHEQQHMAVKDKTQAVKISSTFPKYSPALMPTYIVTNHSITSTIRFFDSSPFSPDNRFLAVTQIPAMYEQSAMQEDGKTYGIAEVVVIDLMTGQQQIVGYTSAWGSQVGAHVQWLAKSAVNEAATMKIVYNDRDLDGIRPIGVIYDLEKHTSTQLDCPIYHLSPDGLYGVAPNMTKIHITQLGYGIMPKYIGEENESVYLNRGAPSNDGLYVIDTTTGKCRLLVSLREIAEATNLPIDVPTYGFHAKWSGDGEKIMFIVRTLETAVRIDGVLGKRFRVQHLITMNKDGSEIRRLISWGSKPVVNGLTRDHDGNHPTWIPGTHKITMNLAPLVAHSKSFESLVEGLIPSGRGNLKWKLVVLDADNHDTNAPTVELYPAGSGHPSARKGGRYILTDAYSKESGWFGDSLKKGTSPLRLIDTQKSREVWLLQMNTVRPDVMKDADGGFGLIGLGGPEVDKKQLNAWRCDMHPSWSNDFQLIAFNGRPRGGLRQVLVARMSSDEGTLEQLFA